MRIQNGIYWEEDRQRFRVIVGRNGRKAIPAFFPKGTAVIDMQRAQELAARARKRLPISTSRGAKTIFADDVKRYLSVGLALSSEDTKSGARNCLNFWIGIARRRWRHDVQPHEWLDGWQRLADRKLKQSTLNNYRGYLVACFAYSDRIDKIKDRDNPGQELPFFKQKRVPRGIPYDVLGQCSAGFDRSTLLRARTAAVLDLMMYTGMRPIEITMIEPEDFRDSSSPRRVQLSIHGRKHGNDRTIRLLPQAAAAVRFLFESGGIPEKIKGSYYEKQWMRTWKRLFPGVKKPRPYDLRHSLGTKIWEIERDIKVVSEYLGHKSLRTTEIYIQAGVSKRLDEAADSLWTALDADSQVKADRPYQVVAGKDRRET